MLNDFGKSLFKPWCSVQNVFLAASLLFLAVLLIRQFRLNSSEVASWVQAVGSIAAIWGAFRVSSHQIVRQNEAKAGEEKQRVDRFRSLVLILARNQQEHLRLLHSTLYNAVTDFGENTINPYLLNHWHLKWPAHIEALKQIDINELDAGQLYMLTEMKVGAQFAWSVCERLTEWSFTGEWEINCVQRLHHYWEMAGLTIALLDSSKRDDTAQRSERI